MKQRIWYILKTYLLTVAIFAIAKVVFMLSYHHAHSFAFTDICQVIWHGLSLDLSTALYFLIVPWLLTVASLWLPIKAYIFKGYYILMALAFSLAFVADTSLYAFWGFKLDASCLDYLSTPTEAMASVTTLYLLVRILLILLTFFLVFMAYQRLCGSPATRTALTGKEDGSHGSRGRLSLEACVYALMIPFIIIGIRGGIGESTTNIGQVYYSQQQFLNHAAVNPVFSFLASFEKTASYIPDYHFDDDEKCQQLIHELFPTESINSDTLLNTTRPDIVIVLLESAGELFAPFMPHLQSLKQQGISFDSCYANSWRTDRGTVCTWSGFPSFPTSSVMKMPSKSRQLPSIARSLQDEGYHTTYLYGGDINFTNMRSYLLSTGFERLHWQKDYTLEEQKSAQWGVRDDITCNTLYDMIIHEKSPFLIGYSTLSTHDPWDVPVKVRDNEIENAFSYLDQCINTLVERLKKTPQWKNLLLILLPDHSMDFNGISEHDARRNHIPMVWIGGAVKAPKAVSVICNQTDLPATLLGQLQLSHRQFRYSRDVLSKNYTQPFAVHTFNNGISVIDPSGFALYDLNTQKAAVEHSPVSQQLIYRGQMVLQAATEAIKNMNKTTP
jgi:phosphoglycerol transferase MdoB-like AlkP superfamily enzyme